MKLFEKYEYFISIPTCTSESVVKVLNVCESVVKVFDVCERVV